VEMYEIDSIKRSIECRQNLVNYFENYLNKDYKPRKAFVDIEDKKSVENYFILTALRLESIKRYFINSKNFWQRDRAMGIF
jgi:hypothetical protein